MLTGFDAEAKYELKIRGEHVKSFLDGIFRQAGIEVLDYTYRGAVWEIRIPEEIAEKLGENRRRFRVTIDRDLASRRSDIDALDIDLLLFRYLLD